LGEDGLLEENPIDSLELAAVNELDGVGVTVAVVAVVVVVAFAFVRAVVVHTSAVASSARSVVVAVAVVAVVTFAVVRGASALLHVVCVHQ